MASSTRPDALFKEPRRIELMRQIVRGLTTEIYDADEIEKLATCYGCLWLADIEKLQYLVDKYLPDYPDGIHNMLYRVEKRDLIAERCQSSSSLNYE
jgi:hypothetical protein